MKFKHEFICREIKTCLLSCSWLFNITTDSFLVNLIISDTLIFVYYFIRLYRNQSGANWKRSGNPLASCSLINLNFLLPHIAHFDESIFSTNISLYNFWVSPFCIFSTLQVIRLKLQQFLCVIILIADKLKKFYQSYLAGLVLLAIWKILIF